MRKFIDNNPLKGKLYDYDFINKEFKNMMKECNAPEGLYDPTTSQIKDIFWSVFMSERSSSKTTQWLLYGALMYKYFGCQVGYVRQNKDQITKTMYATLFNVIKMPEFSYIEYLTDNKFSNIYVDNNKHVYFANLDNTGKVIEQDESPWMYFLSVEEYARYCSMLNVPDMDLVIFDEFSWGKYQEDGFIHFCQILATIRRERQSLRIVMLSNTISPYNMYLQELGISDRLSTMKKGEHAIITSALGTRVYCALLDVAMHKTTEFNRVALSYFGFANENLRSLYGGEWEIKGFKHLPRSTTREINPTNIFIDVFGNMLRLNTIMDGLQTGVLVSRYTGQPKEDAFILTTNPIYNPDKINVRDSRLILKLSGLNKMGLLYVSDNSTGILINELISQRNF